MCKKILIFIFFLYCLQVIQSHNCCIRVVCIQKTLLVYRNIMEKQEIIHFQLKEMYILTLLLKKSCHSHLSLVARAEILDYYACNTVCNSSQIKKLPWSQNFRFTYVACYTKRNLCHCNFCETHNINRRKRESNSIDNYVVFVMDEANLS